MNKYFSIILIFGLGIIVYSNAFFCPFQFDDSVYVVGNSSIRNIHDLLTIWAYYPCRFITFFTLALNYHFHKLDVFGYHLFNLSVHLGCAFFVWWLTLLTLSTPALKENKITQHANLIALLSGLVFVSHPLQTEAVTYIWQRVASMAALFYLSSLCFYVKSRLLQDAKLQRIYYISSMITAVMAMFTKELTITLPLMILFYEFSFLKTKKSFNWKYLIPFLLTLLIIPLTVMLLPKSVRAQEMEGVLAGLYFMSPLHYLLTQFRAIVTYIRLAFLPVNQNLDYDYAVSQSIMEWTTMLSFLFLAGILYFAKRLFSKYRLVAFSIFWFFLTLLPESSVVPLKDVIFEHRLYLPMVGYSVFLVSGMYYLLGKPTIKTMTIILTMIIACNSFLTYQRNKIWRDEFTLWNDTVGKSPHKARPYVGRGYVYYAQGKLTQAMLDFNKAIELDPNYAEAYNDRGLILDKQGNFNQALSDYSKAIKKKSNYAMAYNNRGSTLVKQGHFTEAMSDFNKAIAINPRADAYYNRGVIYDKQEDFVAAIAEYNKAIEIDPQYADAYYNRGRIYHNQNNITQAMADYNKAIEINPKFAEAYNNRGNIYLAQGDFTKSLSDYNKALEINPSLTEAYHNRDRIYHDQNSIAQAMADYNKAIEINPRDAQAHYNRGLAYYNQGYFNQAVLDFTKAIAINPGYAEAYNNRGLNYYKQGDITMALSDYNKAIEIDPKNAQAYNNRGIIEGQSNNLTQSIADFDKAIAIKPDYADAYNNRAVSFYQLKGYDKAWADVYKAEGLGHLANPGFISVLKKVSEGSKPNQ